MARSLFNRTMFSVVDKKGRPLDKKGKLALLPCDIHLWHTLENAKNFARHLSIADRVVPVTIARID